MCIGFVRGFPSRASKATHMATGPSRPLPIRPAPTALACSGPRALVSLRLAPGRGIRPCSLRLASKLLPWGCWRCGSTSMAAMVHCVASIRPNHAAAQVHGPATVLAPYAGWSSSIVSSPPHASRTLPTSHVGARSRTAWRASLLAGQGTSLDRASKALARCYMQVWVAGMAG